jgi:molecular chaperone GrpE
MRPRFDEREINRNFDYDDEAYAEATREKVVDRLHAELQEYKQHLLLNTLRTVFIGLIQLHDYIGKVAVAGPESPDEVRRLVGLMQGFQQGIEDILYRQVVEPFEVEDDAFDARRQRAVATVPTADPARNKAVAVRHRKGFRAGDRVIHPEVVSVSAFRPE